MKIVFAIPDMGSGGAERVISILSKQFSNLGYEVEILMLFGERIHYQLPDSVIINRLNLLQYSAIKRISALRRILKDMQLKNKRLTIFALHDSVLKYILAARVGLSAVRVISAERNNPYIKGKSIYARIKNTIPYLLSNHTVFQTPSAQSYYFLPQRKCTVIPNPITPSEFHWKDELIKRHKLVSVCRLHEQKNIPMTLLVMDELRHRYNDVHLDIYGEGHLKDVIESQIKEMGLEQFVTLKGTTKQVTKILSESSAFISTSDFEGISNSMLEAMSVGMPIVCTDCPIGGANMMLKDDAGILSPVGDVQQFVSRIIDCFDNPESAKKIAKNALSKASEFTPEKIAEKWLQLIIQK